LALEPYDLWMVGTRILLMAAVADDSFSDVGPPLLPGGMAKRFLDHQCYIVIGTERIHVNSVTTGNVLNVTRAQGGTSASAHIAPAPVMSTPLPIMTATPGPYIAGDQAQMCLAGQSGNTSTVIDIGDGWVNVNP